MFLTNSRPSNGPISAGRTYVARAPVIVTIRHLRPRRRQRSTVRLSCCWRARTAIFGPAVLSGTWGTSSPCSGTSRLQLPGRFGPMFQRRPFYTGRRSIPLRITTICRGASSGIAETCPTPSPPSVISNGPSGLTPARRPPGPVWPTATTHMVHKLQLPAK